MSDLWGKRQRIPFGVRVRGKRTSVRLTAKQRTALLDAAYVWGITPDQLAERAIAARPELSMSEALRAAIALRPDGGQHDPAAADGTARACEAAEAAAGARGAAWHGAGGRDLRVLHASSAQPRIAVVSEMRAVAEALDARLGERRAGARSGVFEVGEAGMKVRAGFTDRFAALAMTGALEGAGVNGIPLTDALINANFRIATISSRKRADGRCVTRAAFRRDRSGAQATVRFSIVLKSEPA